MRPAKAQALPLGAELDRGVSFRAQAAQAQGVMAFGQPDALFVGHQRAVKELGRWHPKRSMQQQLSGGGREQIGAAHHLRDPHRRVVHHDGKLVSRNPIVPPDDEIAKVLARDESLRPEMAINERNALAIRLAETPVPLERRAVLVIGVECALLTAQLELLATGSWIHRLVLALVRRRQRPPHVRPRATGAIQEVRSWPRSRWPVGDDAWRP